MDRHFSVVSRTTSSRTLTREAGMDYYLPGPVVKTTTRTLLLLQRIVRQLGLSLLLLVLMAHSPPSAPVALAGHALLQPDINQVTAVRTDQCISNMMVNNTNDSGAGSLRDAITIVCPGGEITFDPDLTTDGPATITLTTDQLNIEKNMTVAGPGAGQIAVSGNGKYRVFYIKGGAVVSITGLTIRDGFFSGDYGGGGIRNRGNLTVVSSTLFSNYATQSGGGIYNEETLKVVNSTFSANGADTGGGIYNSIHTLDVINSTFSGNSATYGGALNNEGTLTVIHGTLAGNRATYYGGGIYNTGTLRYRNTIIANSANGGDCVNNGTISANVNNLVQVQNSRCSAYVSGDPKLGPLQDNGGGTWTMALLPVSPAIDAADSGSCTLTDQRGIIRPQGAACDIGAFEVAVQSAHVWYVAPDGNNSNTCIAPDTASACQTIGGAITKARDGDTIHIAAGTYSENLTVNVSLNFVGEDAATTIVDGGGINRVFNIPSGDVTMSGLTVQNGMATSESGGGIYAAGGLTLTNINVLYNTADLTGGGIWYGGVAPARLINVLFARNAGAEGAAIYLANGGADILHNTIVGAGTDYQSAIVVQAGSLSITNTIIAGYTSGVSQTGGMVVSDYNLFYDAPTLVDIGRHSITGTDPLFVNPAGDNYRLRWDSPAIDTGIDAGVTTDLDGRSRPQGAGFDIGAYEARVYVITPTAGAHGAITPGMVQTVTAGTDSTFTITAVPNYHIADVAVDGTSIGAVSVHTFTDVTANHTITAAFAVNTFTLKVGIDGGGVVNVEPNQEQYEYGSVVTLTATPLISSSFYGWNGDCTTSNSVCVVTMDADKSVTATFVINTYVITPEWGANGVVTPGISQTVAYSDSQVFSITADANYHIVDVGVDGASVGAKSEYAFINVDANHTITAAFAINTYTLTPMPVLNGSIAPDAVLTVAYSATQAFTITADTGYHLVDVGVDGVSIGAVDVYTFTNVTADHTITAEIAINTYVITPTWDAHGSITPGMSQTVAYSATQVFTITADTGYHLVDVGVDSLSMGAESVYTFTNVASDHIITATFVINTYTLTIGMDGNGAGTVDVSSKRDVHDHGSVVTLTANALITSTFIGWSGALNRQNSPVTVTMDGPKTITATFSKTCDPVAGTSIQRQPDSAVLTGNLIHFRAIATGTLPMTSAWTLDGSAISGSLNWLEQTFAEAGTHTLSATVSNACGSSLASMAFTVMKPTDPRPDLSRSEMLVTRNRDGLSYTLILRNTTAVTGSVIMTDPAPAGVTFVSNSLSANVGSASLVEGQVRWIGEVISGTPVIIEFGVSTNGAIVLDTIIRNRAVLDDGSGATEYISVDTTMNPTLNLVINQGEIFTRIPTVTLSYSSATPMVDVRFSNDALFVSNSGWISTTTPGVVPSWVVATDGDLRLARTVYAQFRDGDGTTYGPVSAAILYDPDPPLTPSLEMRALSAPASLGAVQKSKGLVVMLRIAGSDENSGVRTVVLSNDAAFTDPVTCTLRGASITIKWLLPVTMYGVPHIYARSYDRAGNPSALVAYRPPVYQVYLVSVSRR